jgi:septum formation protein
MSERTSPLRLVLASGSPHRRRLLEAAGISFTVHPADLDESAIKMRLAAEKAEGSTVALRLSCAKAETVSARLPGALVIGADQVLVCDGELFDKPGTADRARAQLERLRGRKHHLHSGVALAQDGAVVWQRLETATLVMRAFSDAFLDGYLSRAGHAILGTVGAYEIEGCGIQLFESISGDATTIVGLPMLPLLDELRVRGLVET